MIVALAIGLALGIQAFVVKPYQIPSRVDGAHARRRPAGARQPGLATRLGGDPEIGDVVVFHPPAGRRHGNECGVQPNASRVSRARSRPPSRPTRTSSSGSSPVPGDTLSIKNGIPSSTASRSRATYIRPCRGRRRLQFPEADHHSARPLLHDGRQPWGERRQPLLGPRPPRLDHRRSLLHLLAAGPDRPPLTARDAGAQRGARRRGGEAVQLRPRARLPLRRRRRRGGARIARRPAGRRRRCCSTTSG